jgi:hypothetical protein
MDQVEALLKSSSYRHMDYLVHVNLYSEGKIHFSAHCFKLLLFACLVFFSIQIFND